MKDLDGDKLIGKFQEVGPFFLLPNFVWRNASHRSLRNLKGLSSAWIG
jgi:hypothetical protein